MTSHQLFHDPAEPWIGLRSRQLSGATRLVVFHCAGAGSSMFAPWAALLPPDVELIAVRMPGREGRLLERPIEDAEQIADQAVAHLRSVLRPPFALFGHSMGALIAYLVACRLSAAGTHPAALFVSAHRAPHLPRGRQLHLLSDAALKQEVVSLNGVPRMIAENDLAIDFFLPILRSDLRACEAWQYRPSGNRLACPIHAFGGRSDPTVSLSDLEGWSLHTQGSFSVEAFEGDHFYLRYHAESLIRQICRELNPQA